MNGSWQAKQDQAQWGEGSFCIALGDWDQNEASVSCGFSARSCKSCQHFPIRMSWNALGEYSEVQATVNCLSGHILVAWGALALTWNVKEVPVKSYRNEAFCTGFPAVIPLLWLCSHGRCMAFCSLIFTLWLWYPLHQTLSTYYAHSQIHSVLSLRKYVVQILASLGYFFVSLYINLYSGYLPFHCLHYWQANPQFTHFFY